MGKTGTLTLPNPIIHADSISSMESSLISPIDHSNNVQYYTSKQPETTTMGFTKPSTEFSACLLDDFEPTMTSVQSQLNGLQLSFPPSSQHIPVVMDHTKMPTDMPSSIKNNFNSVSPFILFLIVGLLCSGKIFYSSL